MVTMDWTISSITNNVSTNDLDHEGRQAVASLKGNRKMTDKEEPSSGIEEEFVTVQFFDKDTGKDFDWDLELSRSDYERYVMIADSLGVSFEEFMIDAVNSASQENDVQWSVPIVDDEGNITLEGAEIVEIPVSMGSGE